MRAVVTFAAVLVLLGLDIALAQPVLTSVEEFNSLSDIDRLSSTADVDSVRGIAQMTSRDIEIDGLAPLPRAIVEFERRGNVLVALTAANTVDIVSVNWASKATSVESVVAAPSPPLALDLWGPYAVVTCLNGELLVIDVRNASSAQVLSTTAIGFPGVDLQVVGGRAYVVSGTDLISVNVRDLVSPSIIQQVVSPTTLNAVYARGRQIVASGEAGLRMYSINEDGSLVFQSSQIGNPDSNFLIGGDYTILQGSVSGVVEILDVRSKSFAFSRASIDLGAAIAAAAIDGRFIYVVDVNQRFHTIARSPSNEFQVVQTKPLPLALTDIDVGLDRVLGSTGSGELMFGSVAALRSTSAETSLGYNDSGTRDLLVSANVAFVSQGLDGIRVLDLSDPTSTDLLASYSTGDAVQQLALDGLSLAIGNSASGMQLLDLEPINVPVLFDDLFAPNQTFATAIEGNRIFIGSDPPAIRVLTPRDFGEINTVAQVTSGATPQRIIVSGPHVIAAEGTAGVAVYTQDSTGAISETGRLVVGDIQSVSEFGNRLYISGAGNDTRIVDWSDPTNLSLVGQLVGSINNTIGSYLATPGQLYRLDDPTSPVLVDGLGVSSSERIWGGGDFLFGHRYGCCGNPSGLRSSRVADRFITVSSQSLASRDLFESDDEVARVRLVVHEANERGLSNTSWVFGGQTVQPDGTWYPTTSRDAQVVWEADFNSVPGYLNEHLQVQVESVEASWLLSKPTIQSVSDVPGDQGGWLRLSTQRSGRDFADEDSYPILQYFVLRRVASTVPTRDTEVNGIESLIGHAASARGPHSVVGSSLSDGSLFAVDGSDQLPDGLWEFVGSFPALRQETYLTTIPSLGDTLVASEPTSVVVMAQGSNPDVVYFSDPASAFSVDNLPPAAPSSVTSSLQENEVVLTWSHPRNTDLAYFRVYRSLIGGEGTSATLLAETAEQTFRDQTPDGETFTYSVAAVDAAGNESVRVGEQSATNVPPGTPRDGIGLEVRPTPFNPTTSVYFSGVAGTRLRVRVYDARGRLASELFDDDATGNEQVMNWHADSMPSGVYYIRADNESVYLTRKVTLLK